MSTPPSFSAIYSKGDNFCDFLFAYLNDKVFSKWGLLLKERICSLGSKFFSLRVDPKWDGRQKIKIKELLPLKVYQFNFRHTVYLSPVTSKMQDRSISFPVLAVLTCLTQWQCVDKWDTAFGRILALSFECLTVFGVNFPHCEICPVKSK